MESLLPLNVGLIINYLQYHNGELPVAVDHSQLQTMASEAVNLINWPLSPKLHWAVPPELHILNFTNAGYKSQDVRHRVRREHGAVGMPSGHSGYNFMCYQLMGRMCYLLIILKLGNLIHMHVHSLC